MNIKEIKKTEEINPITIGFCIYFLVDEKDEIVYIGKSNTRTLSRLVHHQKNKKFSKAFLKRMKTKNEMDEKEKKMIFEIRPKYNITILKPTTLIKKLLDEGFVPRKEIKKILPDGLDFRMISNSDFKYTIETKKIDNEIFYPIDIVKKLIKYIKKLNKCPLCINQELWTNIKNGNI